MPYRLTPDLLKPFLKCCVNVFFATFIVLASSIASSYAAPPHLAGDNQKPAKPDLSQRTQIRFLTGTDFPPFNSLSAEGRLSGYNIDLIRAICQELAITNRCQVEARPWNELIPALLNNESDALIAAIQPDRENRATLSFSRPYFSFPARFVALKTTKFNERKFSPDSKTVGVLRETAHEALLKTYFPKANTRPYQDMSALYQDLKNGKIQLIFGDAMSLSLRMSPANNKAEDDADQKGSCCQFVGGAYPAQDFLGQGMVIAVRKQDADLRIAFNNALNSLERKGFLNDLYLRYFPVDFY